MANRPLRQIQPTEQEPPPPGLSATEWNQAIASKRAQVVDVPDRPRSIIPYPLRFGAWIVRRALGLRIPGRGVSTISRCGDGSVEPTDRLGAPNPARESH